jgi:DNA-directed RNA polymerase subunit RPC12/RpoP
MYICLRCGKKVNPTDELGRVRCPFCGYKVLAKERAGVVKVVKVR